MAYSDYGGYVYRNGKRIIERSDWTITEDEKGFESPGVYPGFTAILNDRQDVINNHAYGHAVLGTGPFHIMLYKQSDVSVYYGINKLSTYNFPWEVMKENSTCGFTAYYLGDDIYFKYNGYEVNIIWTNEDNFYVYAELKEPDGTLWHGFSGYGVGAGLEQCGYGFDTEDRIKKLSKLFVQFKGLTE